jgi:hypothetical protein
VRAIRAHVAANPGCVQSTLGKALGIDGRRTSSLIHQLLLAGFITRQEQGRNYALFSSSAGPDPSGSAVSDAHDRPKPGQDPVFVIDAARRIGTAEADLRAAQAEMGGGFQLGDAYWRNVNAESLAAAKRGDWARTGFLYREMARFLAREGKSYQSVLRQPVVRAPRASGVSSSRLRLHRHRLPVLRMQRRTAHTASCSSCCHRRKSRRVAPRLPIAPRPLRARTMPVPSRSALAKREGMTFCWHRPKPSNPHPPPGLVRVFGSFAAPSPSFPPRDVALGR